MGNGTRTLLGDSKDGQERLERDPGYDENGNPLHRVFTQPKSKNLSETQILVYDKMVDDVAQLAKDRLLAHAHKGEPVYPLDTIMKKLIIEPAEARLALKYNVDVSDKIADAVAWLTIAYYNNTREQK